MRSMLRMRIAKLSLIIIMTMTICAIFAPLIARHDPMAIKAESLSSPSTRFWLGTDRLGRDQFSRIIYGARESLGIGVGGVTIAIVAGVSVGTIAAYFGRIVDDILMRIMDALASLPTIVLAMALVTITGGDWINIVISIGITMTPWIARLTRSQVISVKEREYVTAAVATGSSHIRVIVRHILPNSLSPIIVAATMGLGVAIMLEASLSFLGIGVTPPTPTWGSMLRNAFETVDHSPWLAFGPGTVIFLAVLAFNLAGDALRDALDPKLMSKH